MLHTQKTSQSHRPDLVNSAEVDSSNTYADILHDQSQSHRPDLVNSADIRKQIVNNGCALLSQSHRPDLVNSAQSGEGESVIRLKSKVAIPPS
jgi:hypothetical protein